MGNWECKDEKTGQVIIINRARGWPEFFTEEPLTFIRCACKYCGGGTGWKNTGCKHMVTVTKGTHGENDVCVACAGPKPPRDAPQPQPKKMPKALGPSSQKFKSFDWLSVRKSSNKRQ